MCEGREVTNEDHAVGGVERYGGPEARLDATTRALRKALWGIA